MKTKIITTLALAAGLAGLASTSAKADTTHINVSFGFNARPVYTAPAYVPAPVVVAPVSNYNYGYAPRGHWEDVTRRVWIPERWVETRNRWGRPIRVLEPGYFTFRTERVWVENHHGYGYGYRG